MYFHHILIIVFNFFEPYSNPERQKKSGKIKYFSGELECEK